MRDLARGCVILIAMLGIGLILVPWFGTLLIAMIICTGGIALIPVAVLSLPLAYLVGLVSRLLWEYLTFRFLAPPAQDTESEVPTRSPEPPRLRRHDKHVQAIATFIRQSMQAGGTVEQIACDLRLAGWTRQEILAGFELADIPPPDLGPPTS